MSGCKINVLSPGIVKEFIGSLGDFKGQIKPGIPPCSNLDQTETLTKWLVAQMWVGIFAAVVSFVLWFLQGFMPIVALVQGILIAFLGAWLSWFMFCKREPSCCCFCIFTVEGWKQMHLVYGILMLIQAIFMIWGVVNTFLNTLQIAGGDTTTLAYVGINMVITILYNITWFFIGLSAVKIGGKKAGVELPQTVGKAEA